MLRKMNHQFSVRAFQIPYSLRKLLLVGTFLAISSLAAWMFVLANRRQIQMHTDPHVATVWVAGITYGPDLTLTRGSWLLKLLNQHGINALGQTESVSSRFAGDPGGVELWFAYRSHLRDHMRLECHRVGNTAFVDDLSQEYHGFLDFEGDYVGVYLPGYDHAAHRLTCTLHWMPRPPAAPEPVSSPMRFYIDLPPARRILPPADRLSFGPVAQTLQGITATVSNVRLGAPTYGSYGVRQRDLTFHLDIRGGTLAASNADTFSIESLANDSDPTGQAPVVHRLFAPWNAPPRSQNPLMITDPYGLSLISPRDEIAPMRALDTTHCTHDGSGIVWIAPVNGAGRGTDAVHLHFDVLPTPPKGTHADSPAAAIPFDLTIRVQSDDEV